MIKSSRSDVEGLLIAYTSTRYRSRRVSFVWYTLFSAVWSLSNSRNRGMDMSDLSKLCENVKEVGGEHS